MEDCYFYYNSDCSKGSSCPFRHEPAALHSEIVCSFWLQGNCTKVPCPFRHAEVIPSQRQSVTPCYWESKPGGCRKSSCPFLHSGVLSQVQPILPPPKIIVNKNKINEIGPILAQQMESERIVIPASRVPVKERLGSKKPCVKDRLGFISPLPEAEKKEEEMTEEQRLREKAILSLDLRKRIPRGASDEKDESESEEADVIVRSLVQKVKKESKKKKKSKKLKKRTRSRHSASESDDSEAPRDNENELHSEEEEQRRPSKSGTRDNLAARALRDLKMGERKRKSGRLNKEERKKAKKDSKELFETAAKEMESINEVISESNDVLKELEDLIND